VTTTSRVSPCQKPTGWFGHLTLRIMNAHHSKVTDWGLSHISVDPHYTVLDVGCGGGRTVSKLAALAAEGKVYGVDFSSASVAVAGKINRREIDLGRVQIVEGPVSHLPFPGPMFDLITAVETHFWWPDLPGDMREVLRVLKPGGTLLIVAEIYRSAQTRAARLVEKSTHLSGMKLLTVKEHRELLENAGYREVQVFEEPARGWICCLAKKPTENEAHASAVAQER